MTGRPKKSPFLFVNQKIPTNKGPNRKRPLPYDNYCNPDFWNYQINYFLRPITHPDPIFRNSILHLLTGSKIIIYYMIGIKIKLLYLHCIINN